MDKLDSERHSHTDNSGTLAETQSTSTRMCALAETQKALGFGAHSKHDQTNKPFGLLSGLGDEKPETEGQSAPKLAAADYCGKRQMPHCVVEISGQHGLQRAFICAQMAC
ncbi:hypothetical protein Baya_12010 [Bagarius yarrelli]|uniref:Uncharacterized protein n=1 Tax=Bagarius yarrelli TaxID=175774 RepID=A0A556V269_BAGYA|nr:hypothetical protein Baya_12010 [Bagarius yarrelli]